MLNHLPFSHILLHSGAYRIHTRIFVEWIIYVRHYRRYLKLNFESTQKRMNFNFFALFFFQFPQEITKTTTDRDRRNRRLHAMNPSFRPALVYHWPEVALVPLHRTVSSNGNFSYASNRILYLIGRVAVAKNCCMPFQFIQTKISYFAAKLPTRRAGQRRKKNEGWKKKCFSLI